MARGLSTFASLNTYQELITLFVERPTRHECYVLCLRTKRDERKNWLLGLDCLPVDGHR